MVQNSLTKAKVAHFAALCANVSIGAGRLSSGAQANTPNQKVVLDYILRINEAPQGLIVLKAILLLFRQLEVLITVPMIRSRPILAGVSLASIYRTMDVLTSLDVVQLKEYVSSAVTRGPKPQGYALTVKGMRIAEALFVEVLTVVPVTNVGTAKTSRQPQEVNSPCERTQEKRGAETSERSKAVVRTRKEKADQF